MQVKQKVVVIEHVAHGEVQAEHIGISVGDKVSIVPTGQDEALIQLTFVTE